MNYNRFRSPKGDAFIISELLLTYNKGLKTQTMNNLVFNAQRLWDNDINIRMGVD